MLSDQNNLGFIVQENETMDKTYLEREMFGEITVNC